MQCVIGGYAANSADGRERDISEGLNTTQELDEYIDLKIKEEIGNQS